MTARTRRVLGTVLVTGGLMLWALGLFADPLGLGGVSGFNWKQVVLAELGVASILAGALVLWSMRAEAGE